MEAENWIKVKSVLSEVLEIEPPKRQAFLESAGISGEIRGEVESLLAIEEESGDFMSLAIADFSKDFMAADEESEVLLAGQKLGIYEIERELGQGGMGAVYLANRTDGKFKQRVALKLLKREMNTAALRRRFEQEREILASLEHPNIARLLDTGTTGDKIPFLVMEYVEGLPIDEYCDRHALNLNQRLDLFRKICLAVNFAHRNLIVHRDLKPSNILVNEEGTPKLLDFGISKILVAGFEQVNSATVTNLGAMTPGYASPEQLRNESVTTATDVYSLGVIIYELLCGHRPFEAKEGDLKAIYQAVLENEPPPPSALINTISEDFKKQPEEKRNSDWRQNYKTATKINKFADDTKSNKPPRTVPRTADLNRQSLRGDLDNIVLKALRKEPERRYSSAENFAEDLHRHQRGLPVAARPNTFSYRAEKFVNRNRASVFAGVLIFLAVFGGVAATIWQARVAASERDRARLEAEKVKKINAYTQNILNFSNPHWLSSNPKRNRDAKISDALDEALKNIETDLRDEPEIQAEMLFTLGQTYVSQGQFDKADRLLRQSIERFNQVHGEGNLRSMQAFVILGDTLYLTGKFDEAERLYTAAINYFRPKIVEDESQIKWLVIALNDLGNIFLARGKFYEAKDLVGQSVEFAGKLRGRERFVVPTVTGNLGSVYAQIGDYQEALNYYKQALDELRAKGNEESLEGGILYLNIGRAYTSLDDYGTAEEHLQKSDEILTKAVGNENIYTLQSRLHLAVNKYKKQEYETAQNGVKKVLEIQRRIYPEGHFTIAFSQRLSGAIYTKTGDLKRGETEIRQALDILSKTYKEPNHEISLIKTSLGESLIAQKRFAEAAEVLNSALDGYVKTKGANHPATRQCAQLLANLSNQNQSLQ